MIWFDTHAHFEGSQAETATVLRRAYAAGVRYVAAIGGSPTLDAGARVAARLAKTDEQAFPQVVVAVGRDREQVGATQGALDLAGAQAVGEIGLDYHYSPETRSAQCELFAEQLSLAQQLDLPVVIHTREADADTLGILDEIPVRGIIHCFTGSPHFCRQLLDRGWYISLSGIVTFRLAELVRSSARVIPEDRLLLETDAPFLAPVPKRGSVNEPSFLTYTAAFVAALRGVTEAHLSEITVENGRRIWGLQEEGQKGV